LYVIVALIFWFISLQQQNATISTLRLKEIDSTDPFFLKKAEEIWAARKRKTAQYIGEGTAFLGLILVAAVFVYRATRRQFRLSLQQQNFMMAVTHELKTPIAVTRLNLETLQKRKLEEQQQQKLLNSTLQEVDRLNSLCNNILLASQLEAGSYRLLKQEVNISDLAERVLNDFQKRYPYRMKELRISAVFLKIFSKVENKIIDSAGGGINIITPNRLKNFFACNYFVPVFNKQL
jgi:signal transduction histidine kinase